MVYDWCVSIVQQIQALFALVMMGWRPCSGTFTTHHQGTKVTLRLEQVKRLTKQKSKISMTVDVLRTSMTLDAFRHVGREAKRSGQS